MWGRLRCLDVHTYKHTVDARCCGGCCCADGRSSVSVILCAGLSDLLSALPAGVLDEVRLESCRSVSRGARQAAARGVAQLQEYLAAEHA